MIYAGCDLGISTAKVVIVQDGRLLASQILPYKGYPQEAAVSAREMALTAAGLTLDDITSCLATGLGAKAVAYADGMVADIVSLHRAVSLLNAEVRTVLNVGGHSFMAFNADASDIIGESAVTDRCAAGTGMIFDLMSKILESSLDDLIRNAALSNHAPYINNQCPIFIESEVISLINDGWDRYDIFAGIARAVATKIAGLAGRVNLDPEIALVGGVAKNSLVVAEVEQRLGLRLASLAGIDPQLIGAFGAALLAGDKRMRTRRR